MSSQIFVYTALLVLALFGSLVFLIRKERENAELKRKVVDLKSMIDTYKKLSCTDQLTGLGNRHAFESGLKKYDGLFSVENNQRTEAEAALNSLGIVLIDVDDFKLINDTFGHDKGDVVLRQIARTISNGFQRSADIVCRWGGEEFIVAAPNVTEDQLLLLAEKVCKTVGEIKTNLFWLSSRKPVVLSVSIGVSHTTEHFNHESLTKKADKALYAAKKSGKNKVISSNV